MKLFLSSYFFGSNPQKFIEMLRADKKIAVIMNAGDIYGDEKRPLYLAKETEKFRQFGLQAEELDLRDYFEDKLQPSDLDMYGAVWVMGGNSFVLRRAMRHSGFDIVALPLIKDGSIIYAGFSAGSVVATTSLKGIEIIDDPKQVPPGYGNEIIWEGLGLVDFSIAPHYRSDHPESAAIDEVVSYFEINNMPYEMLSDSQAIIVTDDHIEIVS